MAGMYFAGAANAAARFCPHKGANMERSGDGKAKPVQHPYRFGRSFSLGRNKQFQYVYRRGRRIGGKLLALTYLKARDMKVGFSVSAKVGGSVSRNRVKRILREEFRHIRSDLVMGKYVFVARIGAADANHDTLAGEMKNLLGKADLFKRDGR